MSGPVTARVHGPGLPGAGQPVHARFTPTSLVVEGGLSRTLALSSLRVTAGGFDDDALFLHWREAGGDFALSPEDRAGRDQLVAQAPESLHPQLGRWRRGVRQRRLGWNLALGSVAAVGLMVAVAWWQYDSLVAWIAGQVPVATEQQLGDRIVRQVQLEDRMTEHGRAAEAVRTLGTQLTTGSAYRYRWYVKDDRSVNAFAIPGGHVVVHRGLIEKLRSTEELAGVLAHEVQHIELRHTLQNLVHSLGWAAALTVALGDASAIIGVLIHQAGAMSFSRDLERAADLAGVQALHRAGYDPRGMVSFFQRIQGEAGGAELPLLSSHPATAERIARIEAAIAALPARTYTTPAYDWAAIRTALPAELAAEEPEPEATRKP